MTAEFHKEMKERITRDLIEILVENGKFLDQFSYQNQDRRIAEIQAVQQETIQRLMNWHRNWS